MARFYDNVALLKSSSRSSKKLLKIFKKGLTNVKACGIIIKHSGNTEYIKYRGMEQLGSSSGSYPEGRRFKSCSRNQHKTAQAKA